MRLLLLSLAAVGLSAADLPKLTYSKSFPGSQPAYLAITVDKEGNSTYQEAPDDDNPLAFKLSPQDTEALFAKAEKLGRFTRPLESGLKVARMGDKTFRYENGAEKHEVKFNYSVDPDAQALADWFEIVAESEQYFIALERAVKFDKLGVNDALLALDIALDNGRLAAREQFLPLLDRVAKNETFMHMARARAAELAEFIRNPKPVQK
ncbi:MAG: hypothetical protein ACLQGV_02435 [Bryobacteraceae bacterium]